MFEKSKQIPKLADVARLARVSTATVSRCLNTPSRVSHETRERVMAAVNQLGYAPNFNAQALAAKGTNTIGAVIPTMENAIFARGLQAFQEELHQHGLTLIVASSQYQADREEEQIRTLVARGADALLLIGYQRSDRIQNFLKERGLPYVVSWAFDPAQDQFAVGFDNFAAMQELAAKVISLGHRRIAMISARTANNDRALKRVQAVRTEMEQQGFDPMSLMLTETTYSIENGASACRSFLQSSEPPTVILCGNDVLAVGAMSAAKEMGLRVPRDLSITGFDDIELARVVEPQVSTVQVPHREMGKKAA